MAVTRAYEEIVNFIAGTSPREVSEYRPSEESRSRVADLISLEKTRGLTPEETSELNTYLQLEHLMRLAKARARQHLDAELPGRE